MAYNINKTFPIYYDVNGTQTPFHGLEIKKATVESVVMSLGDKISGDVYSNDNTIVFTMQEYIVYENVRYVLVNPPTIVQEGLVKDNSGLNGMVKYSLTFYHPMYMLGNFPMSDIAVTQSEALYLSQNKTFSWIGNLFDFIAKLNKNLAQTEWYVKTQITQQSSEEEYNKAMKLSEVLTFDNNFISDALKTAYDTWDIPFTVYSDRNTIDGVRKNFVVEFGLPTQEILDENRTPFVFRFGQGVGLKNNSRTPKNNKIVTRIIGSGSERNIPYGYPQIRWYGGMPVHPDGYPIYKGIVNGEWVWLIKHPFTRKTLMPTVYVNSVFNKVSPYLSDRSLNPNYNPNGQIIDYYDAIDGDGRVYPHNINVNAPSVEIHQFEDVYPRLGDKSIVSAVPLTAKKENGQLVVTMPRNEYYTILDTLIADTSLPQDTRNLLSTLKTNIQSLSNSVTYFSENIGSASYYYKLLEGTIWEVSFISEDVNLFNYIDTNLSNGWDDTMDDNGEYKQSYFKITLPDNLDFDLYACANITEEMQINMRSGACIGCTFNVQVDWEDYKKNFYNANGEFDPVPHTQPDDGHVRDISKYPDSRQNSISVICQKDLNTFGTLMPNHFQSPASGDKFVILGISLPSSYIEAAQVELDNAAKQYMLENNDFYYEYPLKFDEYFLTTHQNILSQIKNNSLVRFLYNGEEVQLYVKQIAIKFGDNVLPQWDITLTDDIDVVLNKIGQTAEDVRGLQQQVNSLQGDMSIARTNVQTLSNTTHGKIGKFYYYAGEWDETSTIGYSVNETQAPYFLYNHTIGQDTQKEYWLFDPNENGVYTPADMGTPNSTTYGWQPMTSEFKYLITEAIFSQFAHLGSAIISGDWLISQWGTINGSVNQNYIAFDPAHPNDNTGTNFIPNYCVDLRFGTSYQHSGVFGGLTKKSKTYITQENYTEYLDYQDEGQYYGYSLNVEKSGTFIDINTNTPLDIYLPFFYYNSPIRRWDKDYVRSLVGNKILIYNSGDSTISIIGNIRQTTKFQDTQDNTYVYEVEKTSPISLGLGKNRCAIFECKIGFVNDAEEVYWTAKWGNKHTLVPSD